MSKIFGRVYIHAHKVRKREKAKRIQKVKAGIRDELEVPNGVNEKLTSSRSEDYLLMGFVRMLSSQLYSVPPKFTKSKKDIKFCRMRDEPKMSW